MALNFNLAKLRDREFANAEPTVTDAIIWSTMAVGLGKITEENVPEFLARLHFVEALNGPFLRNGDLTPYPITLDILLKFVGLTTNVSNETQLTFMKRHAQGYLRERAGIYGRKLNTLKSA